MRYLTAGESHGSELVTILEGLPAGLSLQAADVDYWLDQRQRGYGRSRRMQIEKDQILLLSGVRAGKTTGAPVALRLENKDHRNWLDVMAPEASAEPRKRAVTAPRPGHVDLAGGLKYRHKDLRDVLERASARETAMRVAVGAICLRLLKEFGVVGTSFVASLGGIAISKPFSWDLISEIEDSPLRCPDADLTAKMIARIDQAKDAGDTLGGVLEVRFRGLVPGLGSFVHWDRKLDGRIAQAVMSVQAIKGVEIGLGFANADKPGSEVHDAIYRENGNYLRHTNRAGGLEGGITNGEELIVRAALKPISTLMNPLATVDIVTHQPTIAAIERSDVTAVPAAAVILQCVIAFVLADAYLEKFGCDSMEEILERLAAYREFLHDY